MRRLRADLDPAVQIAPAGNLRPAQLAVDGFPESFRVEERRDEIESEREEPFVERHRSARAAGRASESVAAAAQNIAELTHVAQDFVHRKREELAVELADWRRRLDPDGFLWVSWPKKSAQVPTDVTEDVVREIALPLGFVDVKVCAVTEVWSGLKLVVRKSLRR